MPVFHGKGANGWTVGLINDDAIGIILREYVPTGTRPHSNLIKVKLSQ